MTPCPGDHSRRKVLFPPATAHTVERRAYARLPAWSDKSAQAPRNISDPRRPSSWLRRRHSRVPNFKQCSPHHSLLGNRRNSLPGEIAASAAASPSNKAPGWSRPGTRMRGSPDTSTTCGHLAVPVESQSARSASLFPDDGLAPHECRLPQLAQS